jgi:adenosylmethionine---8-amino-7-oxononanoate aminotransferase
VSGAIFDTFLGPDLSERTLYHGHSYGGNALAAAVAKRHLELFGERHVLDNVGARAAQLQTLLAERVAPLAVVKDVRQRGLMCGIELSSPSPDDRWGRRVCAEAVRRGVLLRPLGDVVVLMPILTSTADEIERIVDTVVASVDAVCR